MIRKIYWRIKIIWLSLQWIPKMNLGDLVWYKGKQYTIYNGVRYGSWRLSDLDNGKDGWVPRKECKKVWSFKNIKSSFNYGHRFYMTNWYDIWVREGIKPWMLGCNIWPKNKGDRK